MFPVTELQTKYRRDMIDKNNEKQAKAIDSLVNFETVKYFNAEEHEMKRYKQGISDYQNSDWKLRFAFHILFHSFPTLTFIAANITLFLLA